MLYGTVVLARTIAFVAGGVVVEPLTIGCIEGLARFLSSFALAALLAFLFGLAPFFHFSLAFGECVLIFGDN